MSTGSHQLKSNEQRTHEPPLVPQQGFKYEPPGVRSVRLARPFLNPEAKAVLCQLAKGAEPKG